MNKRPQILYILSEYWAEKGNSVSYLYILLTHIFSVAVSIIFFRCFPYIDLTVCFFLGYFLVDLEKGWRYLGFFLTFFPNKMLAVFERLRDEARKLEGDEWGDEFTYSRVYPIIFNPLIIGPLFFLAFHFKSYVLQATLAGIITRLVWDIGLYGVAFPFLVHRNIWSLVFPICREGQDFLYFKRESYVGSLTSLFRRPFKLTDKLRFIGFPKSFSEIFVCPVVLRPPFLSPLRYKSLISFWLLLTIGAVYLAYNPKHTEVIKPFVRVIETSGFLQIIPARDGKFFVKEETGSPELFYSWAIAGPLTKDLLHIRKAILSKKIDLSFRHVRKAFGVLKEAFVNDLSRSLLRAMTSSVLLFLILAGLVFPVPFWTVLAQIGWSPIKVNPLTFFRGRAFCYVCFFSPYIVFIKALLVLYFVIGFPLLLLYGLLISFTNILLFFIMFPAIGAMGASTVEDVAFIGMALLAITVVLVVFYFIFVRLFLLPVAFFFYRKASFSPEYFSRAVFYSEAAEIPYGFCFINFGISRFSP